MSGLVWFLIREGLCMSGLVWSLIREGKSGLVWGGGGGGWGGKSLACLRLGGARGIVL